MFVRNHRLTVARKRAHLRYCEDCGVPETRGREYFHAGAIHLEIHHIIPRNGKKASFSCLNHEDNLVCLCRDCHKLRHGFGHREIDYQI
jgi:5-methylcytosine-specific restriction endonuclease McrA